MSLDQNPSLIQIETYLSVICNRIRLGRSASMIGHSTSLDPLAGFLAEIFGRLFDKFHELIPLDNA